MPASTRGDRHVCKQSKRSMLCLEYACNCSKTRKLCYPVGQTDLHCRLAARLPVTYIKLQAASKQKPFGRSHSQSFRKGSPGPGGRPERKPAQACSFWLSLPTAHMELPLVNNIQQRPPTSKKNCNNQTHIANLDMHTCLAHVFAIEIWQKCQQLQLESATPRFA